MPKPLKESPTPAAARPTNGAPARRAVSSAAPPADTLTIPGLPSAWDLIDKLRVLCYGESGSGKTTFASSFPGRTLWLVCSGGNKPGELRSINTPANRRRIASVVIESTEQLDRVLSDHAASFDNVVLDHGSGLLDLAVKELLGLAEIPVGKSRRAAKGESWSLVSQQQYGQLAIMLKETFRDMLNLPCNVVILCQQRTFGGKDDGNVDPELIKPTIGAALTPSITGWLNPACDYVLQAFKRPRVVAAAGIKMDDGSTIDGGTKQEGVEYCLRCEVHSTFMTKFRMPASARPLPTCLVLGDSVNGLAKVGGYEQLMRVIRGEPTDDK